MHPRLFFVKEASRAATIAFVSCQRDQEDRRARERVEWDTYLVENIPHALMSECRTLDVFDRTEFTRKTFSFPGGNRFLLLSLEYLHYLRVITRKLTWMPTIRNGTPGQWWCTSGNHLSFTLLNDTGETTLKQRRKTSVFQ